MFQPEKIDRFRLVRAEATEVRAYNIMNECYKNSQGGSVREFKNLKRRSSIGGYNLPTQMCHEFPSF